LFLVEKISSKQINIKVYSEINLVLSIGSGTIVKGEGGADLKSKPEAWEFFHKEVKIIEHMQQPQIFNGIGVLTKFLGLKVIGTLKAKPLAS